MSRVTDAERRMQKIHSRSVFKKLEQCRNKLHAHNCYKLNKKDAFKSEAIAAVHYGCTVGKISLPSGHTLE